MLKAISAIAGAAILATAGLLLLPGFSVEVEARTPTTMTKGDRLDVRLPSQNCAQQTWPNIDSTCLRKAGSRTIVSAARVVSADRR